MAVYAFDNDKLLVETMSKADIEAALAQKVNTSTYTSGLAGKADVSHTHSLTALNGNLPFSRITGLSFSLSGSTLTITKS